MGLPTVTKDKISAYNFLDVESLTKTPAELSELTSKTFQSLLLVNTSHQGVRSKPTIGVSDMIISLLTKISCLIKFASYSYLSLNCQWKVCPSKKGEVTAKLLKIPLNSHLCFGRLWFDEYIACVFFIQCLFKVYKVFYSQRS